MAEAIALQRGLELLEDLGCQPVIVESDSLEIIQACNGVIEIWSPYSAILADCFQKALRIGDVSFIHCPRKANRLAHNLARHSFDSNSTFVWDGDPPGFLFSDIVNDVTLI
uniref:RNase H type-1 domain-containing protein n=1 Tax=Triticum urartu TaxID=4572 RepID=A0A8R7NW91_TRIUA